jgi:hypothetical protein
MRAMDTAAKMNITAALSPVKGKQPDSEATQHACPPIQVPSSAMVLVRANLHSQSVPRLLQ